MATIENNVLIQYRDDAGNDQVMYPKTKATNIIDIVPATAGGTGQTSLQATRKAMGLGDTTGALPVANGGHGGTDATTGRNNLGAAAKTVYYNTTITVAAWTGTSAPYTATLSIAGIPAGMTGTVGLSESASDAEYNAAAAAQIRPYGATTANTITLRALGTKPTIAIPIIVTVLG